MSDKTKNDNIVNFKNNTMSNDVKNPKNHICISFIENIKKHLQTSDNTTFNHVNNETATVSAPGPVIKPTFAKIMTVNNEIELLEFYKQNNINGKIPSKPDTSTMTNLNIEKVRRLNDKLKKLNEIETIDKSIILKNKNYWLGGENDES